MIASMKVTDRAQTRWDAIVELFRAACILHRDGKEWESRRIVKEELPPLIKQWMQILPSGLKNDAKADLRDMFTREQSLVDQGQKLQKLYKETLVKHIIPKIEQRIASKYRSLYIAKLQKGKREREQELASSWVQPYYGESAGHKDSSSFGTGDKRVELGKVSEMIDALQSSDNNNIADSILSLDEIVSSMDEAGIDPLLKG